MAMETTHKKWTDLLCFKLLCSYSISLNLTNIAEFYWNWILINNKSFARVHFLHKTLGSLLATTRTTRAKKSRKRWIHPVSKFIAFIPYRSICQMLVNFLELNSKVLHPSFKKILVLSSAKKREIRKFHAVVVQRWQRNVQKSLMYVQSCFVNLSLFPFSFSVAIVVAKAPSG